MKIAIAIGQLNRKAGPSVNGMRLARALLERDWDVRIVHRTPRAQLEQELVEEFRDQLLALPCVHPLDPRYGLTFAHHMRALHPDVVHLNLQVHALVLAPIARLYGSRVVYTMRNLVEYNARWIQRGLKLFCPRFIDRFVGVSQAIADNAKQHRLTNAPTCVVYNGVESVYPEQAASWRLRTREKLGIGPEENVIVTCGRLAPDKQQIHLLEAAALLKNRRFRFVVVGDGEMREQMEEFCRDHSLQNVIFTGWQSDVNRFLSAADIFAFHSMPNSEGLPTVVTEAAMLGLPLVLADIKCLREVYTDGEQSLFATPADPQAFAAALEQVLTSLPLRERLGAEARKIAREEFSVEAMVEKYLDLYEQLV